MSKTSVTEDGYTVTVEIAESMTSNWSAQFLAADAADWWNPGRGQDVCADMARLIDSFSEEQAEQLEMLECCHNFVSWWDYRHVCRRRMDAPPRGTWKWIRRIARRVPLSDESGQRIARAAAIAAA